MLDCLAEGHLSVTEKTMMNLENNAPAPTTTNEAPEAPALKVEKISLKTGFRGGAFRIHDSERLKRKR